MADKIEEDEVTPPEGDKNPPEGDKNPPEGDKTPPADKTPPEGDKTPPEGDKTPPKEKEGEGAPEKYEDFTVPDDFEIDADRLDALTDFGQANNLPQEAVQKAVDLHIEAVNGILEAQQEQWRGIKDKWEETVRADKFFHDDEGNADAAIATAKKAVESIGGDALIEALEITGAGSHPAVLKVFYELGQRITEGKIVFGDGSADTRSAARKLYPSMDK